LKRIAPGDSSPRSKLDSITQLRSPSQLAEEIRLALRDAKVGFITAIPGREGAQPASRLNVKEAGRGSS
jgi:hypothetical protein